MEHREDNLQRSCIRLAAYLWPRLAPYLHHSPNGGKRNYREAARFKAMGVRAGFPDLFLAVPNATKHGLFMELKSEDGRLSDHQEEWRDHLLSRGYAWYLVRSLDDFEKIMRAYLLDKEEDLCNL